MREERAQCVCVGGRGVAREGRTRRPGRRAPLPQPAPLTPSLSPPPFPPPPPPAQALNEAAQETYRARGLILPGFIPGPPGADGNPTGVVDVGITDPFRSHFLRGLLKHPKVGLKDASKEDKLQYLREHCQHIKSAVSGWASSVRGACLSLPLLLHLL